MPIFEYICKDCSRRFEALVIGAKKPQCPHCKSSRLEQKLSVFAVAASGKSAAAGDFSAEGGACGTCGDPRGEGACSMDDLD
jgi:putative FmdB family regulatory protein